MLYLFMNSTVIFTKTVACQSTLNKTLNLYLLFKVSAMFIKLKFALLKAFAQNLNMHYIKISYHFNFTLILYQLYLLKY